MFKTRTGARINDESFPCEKLVILGDQECGKSSLLKRFNQDEFSDHYEPTAGVKDVGKIKVNEVELDLQDMSCQKKDDISRQKTHHTIQSHTGVVLLSFSIANPDSFKNIEDRWYDEVHKFYPEVPIILVGNKLDLRDDENIIKHLERVNKAPVTKEEGEAMADKIKASAYIECSAKENTDVIKVLEMAAAKAKSRQKKKNRESSVVGGTFVRKISLDYPN